MVRKLFLTIFLFLVFSFSPAVVTAIYDPLSVPNNHFGIHILETQELEKAAKLVNSSGGDWGYVTIPIRADDRDLSKWTKFMDDCRKWHLIPILRIATFAFSDYWLAPNQYDLIDFANFLDELPWPTANRYVVVYNEPNHKNEWGGFVDPIEYARILERSVVVFHTVNPDFFIISAGLDSSAPNGDSSENEFDYMREMNAAVPGIFGMIDGFAAHSYGNPAFASAPNFYRFNNVANFIFEENFLSTLGVNRPKLFLTEAGWEADKLSESQAVNYYDFAWKSVWSADNIVAVTPFLLTAASGPFAGFSFTTSGGDFKSFAVHIQGLPKISGAPRITGPAAFQMAEVKPLTPGNDALVTGEPNTLMDIFLRLLAALKLN